MDALTERIELVKSEIAQRQDLLSELEAKQNGTYVYDFIHEDEVV